MEAVFASAIRRQYETCAVE